EGERYASHLPMELRIRVRSAVCDDLSFALRCRMFDTDIQATAPNRITQAPLFIAGQNNKWDTLGFDRAEFGDGKLPGRQNLEQHRFEAIVHLVEFVDQQNTGPLTFERPHEWSGSEEIAALQARLHR